VLNLLNLTNQFVLLNQFVLNLFNSIYVVKLCAKSIYLLNRFVLNLFILINQHMLLNQYCINLFILTNRYVLSNQFVLYLYLFWQINFCYSINLC